MIIATDLIGHTAYQRQLLSGIVEFCQDKPDVELYLPQSCFFTPVPPESIDGILKVYATGSMPPRLRLLCKPKTPSVLMDRSSTAGEYQVHVDNDAVCQLALDHFRACDLHSFAFLCPVGSNNARWRAEAFESTCQRGGYPPSILSFDEVNLKRSDHGVVTALRELPKPVGVLLTGHVYARQFIELCQTQNLRIPEDVQILGIDTLANLNAIVRPSLSYIDVDAKQIGYLASRTLYQLLVGESPPTVTTIKPNALVQRESTSKDVGRSTEVVKALDFMHANMDQQIQMEDLLAELSVSRRNLETMFAKELGDSPMKHLATLRLGRMRHLLAATELSIVEIGRRCGLHNATYLYRLFKKYHGCTPQEYRRKAVANR